MVSLSIPQTNDHMKPRITVIGVGGAGGNAVNNMIRANLEGVEFLTANTDAQAMMQSLASRKIQLGANITRGLGAGARADVGRAAAEEAINEILESIQGSNMVFITAGMGGGTGTGAAPVIARAAREHGILTVGVVTKPFHFEGSLRMRQAEAGIEQLQDHVDTLIIIPNQNLFRVANESTTFADAFNMADQVLHSGVRGVTDLMVMPGLINLDFNDIRSVMSEMGKAMMGTGEAEGARRAVDAAESAISNPLLDDVSMKGARGVLINITGGMDMTLFEVDEAANRIRDEVDPEANIIFGSTFDQTMNGKMRVSVVATGIDADMARRGNNTRGMNATAQPNPFAAMTAANNSGSPATSAPAAMRVSSIPGGATNTTANTSPFATTSSPSNTNATPPSAATASAGINLRPISQNTSSAFGQTTVPAATARSTQPPATAQSGLRVTSMTPSQTSATASTAPSAPTYTTAPQSYGNAALQMTPAPAQAAAPAPMPSLTVVPQTPAPETNFAELYNEEPVEATAPSPWVSIAPLPNTTPAAPTAFGGTSAAPQQTPTLTMQSGQSGQPGFLQTTPRTEPMQPSLFGETEAPRTATAHAPETQKKKGPSLFERVTGLAGGRGKSSDHDDDTSGRGGTSTPGFMGLNLGNAPTAQTLNEPGFAKTPSPSPQLVNQQPAKLSQADEDLLEIPAFLRRQAN